MLEALEVKQTVSDTFFVSLQAAGVSLLANLAAESWRDPFATNAVDTFVSGSSASSGQGATPPFRLRPSETETWGAPANLAGTASPVATVDDARRLNPPAYSSPLTDETRTGSSLAPDTLAVVWQSQPDHLGSVVPRPHGEIRKLKLAPPAAAFGSGNTFVADTTRGALGTAENLSVTTSGFASDMLPTPPVQAGPTPPVASVQATSGQPDATSSAAVADFATDDTTPPENSSGISTADQPAATAQSIVESTGEDRNVSVESNGLFSAGAGVGMSDSGGGSLSGAGSAICRAPSGQSGGSVPIAPIAPCTPPSQQSSSSAGQLFVLNWHDGLVMFPGVIEYDAAGDYVELRSQVYSPQCTSFPEGWTFTES